MKSRNETVIFEVELRDVGSLLLDVLGIEPNRGSTFYEAGLADIEPIEDLREKYRELLEDEDFIKAIRIASEPDVYAINRIGGGCMDLNEVRLHGKASEGKCLAATARAADGTYQIQLYKDYKEYLDWWTGSFAGKSEEAVDGYIPRRLSMEQLLFVLHAIDSFRIVSYKNLLNHIYVEKAYISYSEFAETMADSVRSRDIRWLLPTFMAVLPGFEKYSLKMVPEDAAFLVEQGIMENAKLSKDDEPVMVFGESGHRLGVEFFRFWMLSSGFEIRKLEAEGFETKERFFIAPTAVANHFMDIKGKATVECSSYTREQLVSKLEKLFGDSFKVEDAIRAHDTLKMPRSETEMIYCRACGKQISSSSKFCKYCGAKTR